MNAYIHPRGSAPHKVTVENALNFLETIHVQSDNVETVNGYRVRTVIGTFPFNDRVVTVVIPEA